MNKRDWLIFRIKDLILKCRSKGKFLSALKLRNKLKEIK